MAPSTAGMAAASADLAVVVLMPSDAASLSRIAGAIMLRMVETMFMVFLGRMNGLPLKRVAILSEGLHASGSRSAPTPRAAADNIPILLPHRASTTRPY